MEKVHFDWIFSTILPVRLVDREVGLRSTLRQVWRDVNFNPELLGEFHRAIRVVGLGITARD